MHLTVINSLYPCGSRRVLDDVFRILIQILIWQSLGYNSIFYLFAKLYLDKVYNTFQEVCFLKILCIGG